LIVSTVAHYPTHKADVFEVRINSLYPLCPLPRTSALKLFFFPCTQSYVGGLYKDQGLAATKDWLDKLFTPYVKEAYRIVREQHGLPPAGVSNELQVVTGTGLKPPTPPPELPRMGMATTTLGHLGLFNQRLQQQCLSIEWVFDDTVTESNRATPVWAAKALVDGACWGYGRGNTKKAAKNEAAKEGLRQMGFDEVSPICVPCAASHYSHARHRVTSSCLQTSAGREYPECPLALVWRLKLCD
jgi:hypothetical protein